MKDIFLTRMLIGLAVLFSGCLVADDANLEYKIKAGYLYNFTKFITWPEVNGATFNLCILGADPFGALIDPIQKKAHLTGLSRYSGWVKPISCPIQT